MPVHLFEQRVAARLKRQVELARHVRLFCHDVNELFRRVFRVARHKSDDIIAVDGAYFFDEVGKIALLAQSLAVGIDVLPEQRYLLVAALDKPAHLVHDVFGAARTLASAHVWDDAVRAEIVAAVHYAHPRLIRALAAHRHAFRDRRIVAVCGEHAAVFFHNGVYYLRQGVKFCRAEYEINVRIAVFYLVAHIRLRHHASADADDEIGVFIF